MRDRLILRIPLPPLSDPGPIVMRPWTDGHAILIIIIIIRHRPRLEAYITYTALPGHWPWTVSRLRSVTNTRIRFPRLPSLCLLAPLCAIHERIVHAAHLLIYSIISMRDTRDRHQHQENNQTKHMPTPISTRIQWPKLSQAPTATHAFRQERTARQSWAPSELHTVLTTFSASSLSLPFLATPDEPEASS